MVRIMTFSKCREESRPIFVSLKLPVMNIYELTCILWHASCTCISMINYLYFSKITLKQMIKYIEDITWWHEDMNFIF